MTTWTSGELNKIGKIEELQIASLRADGTSRNLVAIWAVRLGDGALSAPIASYRALRRTYFLPIVRAGL